MAVPAIEARLRIHPDDRASWLVYADWLGEHGDVRGRLILLEHRRAAARREAEVGALQRDIDALVAEHRDRWARGAPPGADLAWQHGFVTGLTVPWTEEALDGLDAWLQQPEARLLATLRLRLPDDAGPEVDFDDIDWDDPTPDLTGRVPPDLLDRFVALDLRQLVTLDLAYGGIGTEGARAVAAAQLGEPRSLDLRYCRLGDDGVRAVAEAPTLRSVRSLWLHGNHVGPEGALALAASPHLGNLRTLDLRFDPIGEHGARALAGSPVVAGLEALHVHVEDIGPAGVRALAESPRLPSDLRRFWSAR